MRRRRSLPVPSPEGVLGSPVEPWRALDMVDDAVVVIDRDARICFANEAAFALFGHDPRSLLGSPLDVLIPEGSRAAHGSHLESFATSGEAQRRMAERSEVRGLRSDGSEFPADISICRVEADGETLMLAFVRDVSDRAELTERIGWLSGRDRVTGLLNRQSLIEELERHPDGAGGALLVLDVEGFGMINAVYGNDVGDDVLVEVADRLVRLVEPGRGKVARLGNDEFAVFVPDVGDSPSAGLWAERLRSAVGSPMTIASTRVELRVAMGARLRRTTDDAAAVVADALAALGVAQVSSPRHVVLFDESIRNRSCDRLRMGNDLQRALADEELWLAYQPIVDTSTGRARSAEALLRWTHPEQGAVSPSVFVSVAEETGLIHELGQWTVRRACEQIAAWEGSGWFAAGFQIAVNVSALQLRDQNVVDDLRSAMASSSIDPARLRVEVTETLAMEDVDIGIEILRAISALGISIGLDDFGTGYSSLAQLGRLPIDEVKIDRAFVARLGSDPAAETIVSAVLAIADVFGMEVVAEGVERADQLALLRSMGCPLIQGWFFAQAQGPDEFVATVEQLGRRARLVEAAGRRAPS